MADISEDGDSIAWDGGVSLWWVSQRRVEEDVHHATQVHAEAEGKVKTASQQLDVSTAYRDSPTR